MAQKTVTAHHPQPLDKLTPVDQVRDCIKQVTVFDVQWSNCPLEVEKEVRQLWRDHELGNDTSYLAYKREIDVDENDWATRYPKMVAYLDSRGIRECLIHWWW